MAETLFWILIVLGVVLVIDIIGLCAIDNIADYITNRTTRKRKL